MIALGRVLPNVYATSGWGDPRAYRNGVHEGMDLRAATGVPVFAAAAGKVAVAREGTDGNAGLFVALDHADGTITRYLHLSRIDVQKEQLVGAGQQIGLVGDTGSARGKPHLHLDVRIPGALLAEYIARFRLSIRDFPKKDGHYAVPAEPLIPVDTYAPHVIRTAKKNGIPLYGHGLGLTDALIAGGLLLLGFKILTGRRGRSRG